MARMVEAHPLLAQHPPEPWDRQYYYAAARGWAALLADALTAGVIARSELRKVAAVCEDALAGGDALAAELVTDDLFNIMLGRLYRELEPARRFEEALGPRARRVWGDLIEEGVGEGVRDVAAWSAVVRNGEVAGFCRVGPDGAREVRREGGGGRLTTRSASAWIEDVQEISGEAFEREVAWLRPLRASRWGGPLEEGDEARCGLDMPMATLTVFGDRVDGGDRELRYGAGAPGGGRWVTDGEELFVIEAWWEHPRGR